MFKTAQKKLSDKRKKHSQIFKFLAYELSCKRAAIRELRARFYRWLGLDFFS